MLVYKDPFCSKGTLVVSPRGIFIHPDDDENVAKLLAYRLHPEKFPDYEHKDLASI